LIALADCAGILDWRPSAGPRDARLDHDAKALIKTRIHHQDPPCAR
jgi:hypothetical protein